MKTSQPVLILFSLLLFIVSGQVFAQNNKVFLADLSEGWKVGNTKLLTPLLDDKVSISSNGKEYLYSKEEAAAELHRFFGNNRPVNFNLRHSGASADGQLYLVGSLDIQGGANYKIVCRARSWNTGYRIFKLDMTGGN